MMPHAAFAQLMHHQHLFLQQQVAAQQGGQTQPTPAGEHAAATATLAAAAATGHNMFDASTLYPAHPTAAYAAATPTAEKSSKLREEEESEHMRDDTRDRPAGREERLELASTHAHSRHDVTPCSFVPFASVPRSTPT